jgi:hypothetical protein
VSRSRQFPVEEPRGFRRHACDRVRRARGQPRRRQGAAASAPASGRLGLSGSLSVRRSSPWPAAAARSRAVLSDCYPHGWRCGIDDWHGVDRRGAGHGRASPCRHTQDVVRLSIPDGPRRSPRAVVTRARASGNRRERPVLYAGAMAQRAPRADRPETCPYEDEAQRRSNPGTSAF